MVFLIYGADHLRCRQQLNILTAAFQAKRDNQGVNICHLDGEKATANQIRQELATSPFLGDKRLVIVDNVWRNKKNLPAIIDAIDSVYNQAANDLIFIDLIETADHPSAKFLAAVKKLAYKWTYIWHYPVLNTTESENWLLQKAKEQNLDLDRIVAKKIITITGPDSYRITSELEKLSAYCGDGKVTAKHIDELITPPDGAYSPFGLLDAIGDKNHRAAITWLEHATRDGASNLLTIGSITRHLYNLSLAKDLDKSQSAIVASQLKIHPFVLQKASQQARQFDHATLTVMYRDLMKIEEQAKSTNQPIITLLMSFITDYCPPPLSGGKVR